MDTFTLMEKRKDIFARFGLPNVTVSDNGPQFRGCKFVNFWKMNGINFYMSPPFHPVMNGVVENTVKSFKAFKSFKKIERSRWIH